MSPTLLLGAASLGVFFAIVTFAIQHGEEIAPDASQIQSRDGLGQMLSTVLAWAAVIGALGTIVVISGIIPALVALAAIVVVQRLNPLGRMMRPLFRLRMVFAGLALACSLISLIFLLSSLEGAFNV